MAIMIPDSIREETKSSAEIKLFPRLRDELPHDFTVLHSLGLTNHRDKFWAECDFVIISPSGIFVIEVKGGRLSFEKGRWFSINRKNEKNQMKESPWEQAKDAMFAIREYIQRNPNLRGFLYGYGVVTPDEDFKQASPEIDLKVLLPRSRIRENLSEYVSHLTKHWQTEFQNKRKRRSRSLNKKDIEIVRRALRPDIVSTWTLNSHFSNIVEKQIDLTEEQSEIVANLDINERTIISGGAGTGKTLIAIDKAFRLAEEGSQLLYLCYNSLLGEHIRSVITKRLNGVPIKGTIDAWSIHQWFSHTIRCASLHLPKKSKDQSDEDFYQETYPNTFMEAFDKSEAKHHDVIIIDEGQDLMRGSYFDAIDFALKDGLSNGQWHVFLDPAQNIYKTEENSLLERLNNYYPAKFSLTKNCRNTIEIATATAEISRFDTPLNGAIEGGRREIIYYAEGRGDLYKGVELVGKLGEKIKHLLAEGVTLGEIVILSHLCFENSAVRNTQRIAGYLINDLSSTKTTKNGHIDFCTIQGFKGLERKVVFVIDLQDLMSDRYRHLNYCGLSRARTYLGVCMPIGEKTNYRSLAANFSDKFISVEVDLPAEFEDPPLLEALQSGTHVNHPKFGNGSVISVYDSGEDAKVVVYFNKKGKKTLLHKYSRLTLT